MTRAAVLLAAGWALLLAAWVVGNPPFAAPDEGPHLVRALAVADGQWIGAPAQYPVPMGLAPGVAAKQKAWVDESTRLVRVPAPLVPPPDCYVRDPRASAACLDAAPLLPEGQTLERITTVGTYQPLPYLLPALAVGAAERAGPADRLARAATALPALLLLAAAAWALAGLALGGLLVAVTPMVLFSAASLNGSGLETAAAIAFAAALIRVARGGAPAAAWALAGSAGAVLALSRSTGPLWMVLLLAIVPVLAGGRAGTLRVAREGGRPALVAGIVAAGAVIANRVWEAAHGPDVILSLANPRSAITGAVDQLGQALPELVGRFGYLEYDLPLWIVGGWALLALVLLGLALRAATGGRRLVLLAAVVTGVAVLPLALHVVMYRHTGFGLQGRHFLPVAVALPLLAGELLARRPASAAPFLVVAGVATGLAQLGAWWANARRSAVGIDGSWWFHRAAEWAPPGGWVVWTIAAAAGAVLVAAAGFEAARTRWLIANGRRVIRTCGNSESAI